MEEDKPLLEHVPHTRNKLGTINGVIVPCLLNILGIVLFLRLSWAVGQVGWLGLLVIFAVAETQAVFTIFSVTAIVTNGKMEGGGSYYMISRSLGPELGGAIGFLFYVAYAVGTTFYCIGFGTEFMALVYPTETVESGRWMLFGVSSAMLFAVLIVSLAGAEYFTKINVPLFCIQFGCTLFGLGCLWFAAPKNLSHGGRFLQPSWERLIDNKDPDLAVDPGCDGSMCAYNQIFAIVFPAATGFMEGANLSGDLARPGYSIGRGTLTAVGIAIINYILLIFTFAASFDRNTLRSNPFVFQDTALSEYVVVVAILISSCSSALGSIFGGSRVLQALAKDEIFPGISLFGYGTKKGNEPIYAVFMTWAIAQCCLFIGSLDAVAPVITCFFCLSYACVNLACFLVEISGTPNFRPKFRYYSWHSSLLGFLLNLAVMFYLNPFYGGVSIAVLVLMVGLIVYIGPVTTWGDVRQAIIFHQVRKYLLQLDVREPHMKLWRPSVLLFCHSRPDRSLVRFCNNLKRGGLYIVGKVHSSTIDINPMAVNEEREGLMQTIMQEGVKAFPQVSVAPTQRLGFSNLLLLSGLGALDPNTIVMSLEDAMVSDPSIPPEEVCVTLISDALKYRKNVVLACGFARLPDRAVMRQTLFVDMWLPADVFTSWETFDGTPMLVVQLSHILATNPAWPRLKLRVFCVCAGGRDVHAVERQVVAILDDARVNAFEVNVLAYPSVAVNTTGSFNSNSLEWCLGLKSEISRVSATFLALLPMPSLPSEQANLQECKAFNEGLRAATAGLPAVAFVAQGQVAGVMSRMI